MNTLDIFIHDDKWRGPQSIKAWSTFKYQENETRDGPQLKIEILMVGYGDSRKEAIDQMIANARKIATLISQNIKFRLDDIRFATDEKGRRYTEEDGYITRYWFLTAIQANHFIEEFRKTNTDSAYAIYNGYPAGKDYPAHNTVEFREDKYYTVDVNFDPITRRLKRISGEA